MYVGLKMLRNFVQVSPYTLVKDAQKKMEADKLWMLLVVDDEGELVGYVRKEDIATALPNIITSLEEQELNSLMHELTVEKICHGDITKVTPETEIEAAADMMYEMNLTALAVANGQGHFMGYINQNVMFDVLSEEMGYREGGSRIAIEVDDRFGVLYEVAGIIANMKISIISTGTFFYNEQRIVVVRIEGNDPTSVKAMLKERGYKLVSSDDFVTEWS